MYEQPVLFIGTDDQGLDSKQKNMRAIMQKRLMVETERDYSKQDSDSVKP